MKTKVLTRVLGMGLTAALVLASPVFAHDSHYRSGHVDHDYSYGGHVDHEYGNGRHVDHDYSYGGHVDHEYGNGRYGDRYYSYGSYYGYARPPYYGNGYDHPAGTRGYLGKDARHHRRGHRHHHGR